MDAAVRLAEGAKDERTRDEAAAWLFDLATGAETFDLAEFRRTLRDRYIWHAGHAIAAPSRNARAKRLADRVRLFGLDRWPKWEPFAQPPRQADAVDAMLFLAWKIGPHPIPASPRRLDDLL